MSSFASFVAGQVLSPRLRRTGVLIVYDPWRRYQELCLGMAADTVCVVDAGSSSIESREAAMAAFRELGRPSSSTERLLVYVPANPPLCDEVGTNGSALRRCLETKVGILRKS